MPIFISYSRKDSRFVDKLAVNLIKNRHHVWMDRWELKVGDSLGAARDVVGIWRGAISGNMKVSFQAARSIG